jgi:hypothetical protein
MALSISHSTSATEKLRGNFPERICEEFNSL